MHLYHPTGQHKTRTHEHGNALILIFIAVVLFAALSFTVSDMLRGANPEEIGDQKAEILANGVLSYARAMRTGMQDMRANGCRDMDISFENGQISGYEHSPVADEDCKLFGPSGGGINYIAPAAEWLDSVHDSQTLYGQWFFPEDVCVPKVGTSPTVGCASDGTDNEDLIAILPYMNGRVCRIINETLGYGSTIPVESGNAWDSDTDKFAGVQNDGTSLDQVDLMAGCFEGATGSSTPPNGSYHFFQVLVPR